MLAAVLRCAGVCPFQTACPLGAIFAFTIQTVYNNTNMAFRDKMRKKATALKAKHAAEEALAASKESSLPLLHGHERDDEHAEAATHSHEQPFAMSVSVDGTGVQ